jgi:hypothetical protein
MPEMASLDMPLLATPDVPKVATPYRRRDNLKRKKEKITKTPVEKSELNT